MEEILVSKLIATVEHQFVCRHWEEVTALTNKFNRNALVDGRGSVRIGKDVLVGPGAQLISYQHRFADLDQPINRQGLDLKEIALIAR